jgi:hypothetical protein
MSMRLANALLHSPNSDANSPRLNSCQSFLRNSLTVILNLHTNLVRLNEAKNLSSI